MSDLQVSKAKTLKHDTKDLILRFFTSSSAHGVPRLFTSEELILKLMWLIMFITSATYMIASCITLVIDYYNYPTSVSILTYQEIPAKFPAVTICNQKLVNKTKNPNFTMIMTSKEYDVTDLNWAFNSSYSPYDQAEELIYTTQMILNEASTNETEMSYDLKDMLFSCAFNKNPCSEEDFDYLFDPRRGNCYTFNKGYSNGTGIRTVSSSIGPKTGLVLELFVGNPDIDTYYDFNDGVVISIHNQSFLPFTEDLDIKAAAGAETDFIVSRNFIKKLPSPYGNCLEVANSSSTFSSFIFDYIVRNQSLKYSQRYCFSLCQQRVTMNICNCSNYDLPLFEDIVYSCQTEDDVWCKDDIISNFDNYTSSLNECIDSCPYECSSIKYQVISHSTLYPNKYYAENILSFYAKRRGINISMESIYSAFAKINIYYDSMQYTRTIESASTALQQLVANIGGYFGLCMGLSLLSLVEVFELFVRFVLLLKNYNSKRNKIIMVQSS